MSSVPPMLDVLKQQTDVPVFGSASILPCVTKDDLKSKMDVYYKREKAGV